MNKTPRLAHKKTAGYREPTLDPFSDVKTALSDYLRKNDPAFIKASEDATRRNAEVKARRNRESEKQTL